MIQPVIQNPYALSFFAPNLQQQKAIYHPNPNI